MRKAVLVVLTVVVCCGFAAENPAGMQALHRKKLALESLRSAAERAIQNSTIASLHTEVSRNLKGLVSHDCRVAVSAMLHGLVHGELWALEMIDAAGKMPTAGLLVGNLRSLGSFWECVSTTQTFNATAPTSNPIPIRGQYCLVALSPINVTSPLDALLNFELGLCTPDACNATDIYHVAGVLFKIVRELGRFGKLFDNFAVSDSTCQVNYLPLDGLAISGICVVAAFIFLVLVGSTYDTLFAYTKGHIIQGIGKFFKLFAASPFPVSKHGVGESDRAFLIPNGHVNVDASTEQNGVKSVTTGESESLSASQIIEANGSEAQEGTVVDLDATQSNGNREDRAEESAQTVKAGVLGKILSTFSIRANGAAIFSTKQSAEQFDCLHGLRVLSMIWIIAGHVYSEALIYSTDIVLALKHYVKSWSFQLMWNATFSVDTFFVISGLLTTYITLKYITKVGGPRNFSWHLFYVHRYLRLTPVMALMIYLYVADYPYLSFGPLWPQQRDQACTDYWWTNVLYINNFYNMTAGCFGHTWYLANDMQFFIISPLVIIPLYSTPLAGLIMILVLIVISIVSTAVISAVNGFSANLLMGFNVPQADSLGPITESSDIYVKPYCRIGSYAIGMLVGYILFRTKRKLTLNPWVVVFGWAVSTTFAILVLWVLYDSISNMSPLTTAASAAYLSLSRIAWSISIGWIILACSTGYGGWVNKFLSWKAFAPLSRLTYCAYLVHFQMLNMLFTYVDTPSDIREFPVFFYASGYIILAYAAALGFSLAVEAPFLGLEKLIFGR